MSSTMQARSLSGVGRSAPASVFESPTVRLCFSKVNLLPAQESDFRIPHPCCKRHGDGRIKRPRAAPRTLGRRILFLAVSTSETLRGQVPGRLVPVVTVQRVKAIFRFYFVNSILFFGGGSPANPISTFGAPRWTGGSPLVGWSSNTTAGCLARFCGSWSLPARFLPRGARCCLLFFSSHNDRIPSRMKR
jgi:hypothetical protein